MAAMATAMKATAMTTTMVTDDNGDNGGSGSGGGGNDEDNGSNSNGKKHKKQSNKSGNSNKNGNGNGNSNGNSDDDGGDAVSAVLVVAAVAYCRGCLLDDVKLYTIFWMGGGVGKVTPPLTFSPLTSHLRKIGILLGGDGN